MGEMRSRKCYTKMVRSPKCYTKIVVEYLKCVYEFVCILDYTCYLWHSSIQRSLNVYISSHFRLLIIPSLEVMDYGV